jgi:hypothetical protein
MKHIRAVVKMTNSRPKIRPMVVLSCRWLPVRPRCFRRSPGPAGPPQSKSFHWQWVDCPRRLQLEMQLCHTHRQLLSRCILRWYSAGTGSDTISASDVQVPPRLKRPVASSFGGINIRTSRPLASPISISIVFIPISPIIFF